MSIPIPTPYPYPWGAPYPRQSPGLPWGRSFYPHIHPIPIPMGIPIPTAESRVAVGTEFLSPYPPQTHTNEDPHTHGRVQGCRGDGISIPIPIPMGIPMRIPMPTADLASERTMLVCLVGPLQMTSVGRCRELNAEHTELSIATTCSTDDVARFRERHGLERDYGTHRPRCMRQL